MAFVSGEGMRPSSSSNGIPNGISDQQAQSQDFRAALQQQLMAMQQQQQQQQATQQAPPPSASQLTGNNLLYQQLLAQQLQNQQPQLSSQTQQPNPQLALQQQLAALQNLSNPSAALLQQQFPGGALGQPAANNGVATALAALIATNPAILQALAGTAATTPNTLSLLMQLLMPNAASTMVQPQQQSLLSLIQLLTNPASALLNYPSLLQQPLHQAQPAQQVNQLSALTQLLGANAGGNNANWHQLSAALGGAGAVPNTTNSTDESRAYLDQLLRQVQEQQHQQQQPQQQQAQQQHPQPVAASNNNTPRPMLSAQNSSSSLLGNVQHSASTSNNSLTSNNSAAPNRESALQQVQLMDTSGPLSSNESANYNRSNERQPSSERLLNAESVQDHITRLINENEAIVEPNPVLLKRRPYNRTNTSNSIASQSSVNDNGSQRGSPSIRSPGLQTRVPTTRSQSLHEASMLNTFRAVGGSLTSGQPVFRPSDRYPQQLSSLTCNFCGLKFPNEAGLEAHEFRCSKKEQLTKQHSQPQLQLHSISAQSQVQQQVQLQAQLLILQQQKALLNAQQQQSFMAANAAGITADTVSGRSSAPDSPSGSHKLGFQPVHSSSPSSLENRHPLKKRLLEAAAKEAEIVDVVSINEPQTSAKMPKMELTYAENLDPQLLFKNETEDSHFDQPSSSHFDPNVALLRQVAAQQELVAKHARELSEKQEEEQQQEQHVQSATSSSCPKTMSEAIGTALLYIEAKVSDKMPYVVTLSEQITAALKNEGAPPTALCATPYRNRMRNITQDTFVCLHRPQPMFVLQKKNLSMYSNWQQAQVSPQEANHIQMYFKTYSTKPRIGTKELYRFTLANKDRNQLRLTHSTFWMLLNKHRMQVSYEEQQNSNAMENFQNYVDEATPGALDELHQQLHIQRPETPLMAQQAEFLSPKHDIDPLQQSNLQTNQTPRHESNPTTRKDTTKGMSLASALAASKMKPLGGNRVDEVDVYIRGRGRGRYVCERCGIRCKKPSMLKKHLRSHTNIRPFSCTTCNFSFKTKGNLTKHLCSKAHRRRLAEKKMDGNESAELNDADENRLMNEEDDDLGIWESKYMDDEDKRDEDDESDNEDVEINVPHPLNTNNINYRRFGQENILIERSVHTPPTCWMRNLCGEEPTTGWSSPNMDRSCNSAPPVVEVIHSTRKQKVSESSITVPQRFASIPTLNKLEMRDELNIQQNFLINDISPPASADVNSAMNSSNSLIANFIPLSKQPTEAERMQQIMMEKLSSSLYFLQAASSASAGQYNEIGGVSISNEDASKFDAKKISSASMEAFLASEAQDLVCDMCDKKFRKESELLLHKQTHLIERQQNARARTYLCPECKINMRSKQHLAKHIETVHAGANIQIDDDQTTTTSVNLNPSSSGQTLSTASNSIGQMLLSTSSSSARSFVCKDCNLGFRTHGVLAKHLRSKNHVKTLSSLGKLPDDAINLIKENSNVLANVDATDSESAYESLFQIIANLRGTQTTSTSVNQVVSNEGENSSSSLECREQLGAQSPGPQTPNGYKFNSSIPSSIGINSGYPKAFPPLPVSLKRKNERPSPGEPQSPPVRRPRCNTGLSQQRAAIDGLTNLNNQSTLVSNSSGYTSPENAASPLHSLATIATANRSTSSPSVGNVKTIAANVWIPPRFDQLDRKAMTPDSNSNGMSARIFLDASTVSEHVASNRSTEENSEGRSEASTPVQRASVNGTIAASPMSQATKCNVCDITFDTPCDLQVHLHADHIIMRDGREFKCPKRHCEKVYPTRENLKAHIIAHYYGGGATPTFDVREENEYAPSNHIASSPSELITGSPQTLKKPSSAPQHQMAASFVPNNSPDAPEESNTTQKLGIIGNGMRAPMFSTGVYNVPRQSTQQPLTRPKSSSTDMVMNPSDARKNSLPCAMCGQHFADAAQLQCHWVSDHMPQMNSRPYVCKECDAGFASKFQLEAHIATHAK